MLNGFIRVAAASPSIVVGDLVYNAKSIMTAIDKANSEKVKIIVFPELSLTGMSIESLFEQEIYTDEAMEAIFNILKFTETFDMVIIISAPYLYKNKLYDVAFVIKSGSIIGIVPKSSTNIETEYSHDRIFESGLYVDETVQINDFINNKQYEVPFSRNLLFRATNDKNITFTVEIGKDSNFIGMFDTICPLCFANIVFNPSTNSQSVDYGHHYFDHIINKSKQYSLAYISCGANVSESTAKEVFSSKSAIIELGDVLNEREAEKSLAIASDVDFDRVAADKKKNKILKNLEIEEHVDLVEFEYNSLDYENNSVIVNRSISPLPYLPSNTNDISYAYKVLNIQAMGLCKRMNATRMENVVLGVSGGLDSTIALMAVIRAYDILGLDKAGVHLISMPCFGSSKKTHENAQILAGIFGLSLQEIDIQQTVFSHFNDISHDVKNMNVTYENAQARERTQVLFDLANDVNGLVIGTGDLSEIALGFSTYNGDQMSSYNVNGCVPKTLMRYMAQSFIKEYSKKENTIPLSNVLKEILAMPVSPELLPQNEGQMQSTEQIVGPYELNDFFLYYVLKYGFSPRKILARAEEAFLKQREGLVYKFNRTIILSTLKSFYKRFVCSAFKRNASPDSPSIGLPSLNNANTFYFPADCSPEAFLINLDNL